MKQRTKSAFTLTEILVTLSITGIVALMAIPQLITSVQKHKNTAVLGRSVQNIENGCQKLMVDATSMYANGGITTSITDNRIIQAVTHKGTEGEFKMNRDLLRLYGKYFNVEDMAVPGNYRMSEYDGTESVYSGETNVTEGIGASVPSVSYTSDVKTAAYIGSSSTGNESIPYLIFIDANGATPPNRFGRDIFMFGLDSSCHMIPAGSQKIKDFADGGILTAEERERLVNKLNEINDMLSSNMFYGQQEIIFRKAKEMLEAQIRNSDQKIINSEPYNTLDTETCLDGDVTKGLTCTARIVKDGFKIKYE